MKSVLTAALAASMMLASGEALAQKKSSKDKGPMTSATFNEMKLRNIGPAYMSGRIADIEVDQNNPNIWYVAVGSGGIWKTVNAGTTWTPIFDKQKVYSTGDVTIDPSNSNIIWVGSGENNGGRHISYGDGVYKSMDGGKTWKNMGLAKSERIGDIVIHPEDSNIVWVSAQGPLWTSGGERGLYKTTDGGKTWKNVLKGDEWTGIGSLIADPRNPDKLYAATWSRQRTIANYVGTNKGSGIHTSDDGGETWTKLSTGLPKGNMGKIGLAISPVNPDVVYATIETDNRKGGFWRSSDLGASWKKMSNEVGGGTGPHYYQEIFADQHQMDRVYIASNYSKVSDDGGKTWTPINTRKKHVDDHAMAFHPTDPDFVLIGSDGGIYMSHDRMSNWRYIRNLPLTQFYKIDVDATEPFYNVYGGTQDNSTQGGPSRTGRSEGIKNKDWFLTQGGDGHQPATEHGNPNIMYSQSQQGFLTRRDTRTKEIQFIQPQPKPGEPAERFNWDAPINVSTHDPKRIYHASQRVWRSDDRGDSWTAISGDLTKNGNRMHMPMMGRTWSVEAGWDIYAMSNFHTIANFSESPVDDKVLWTGSDDGLIHVTTDGGKNWKKIDIKTIKGIPENAYVNDIRADLFDRDTVYVALDNHKEGDFKPYLIKSTNLGKSWTSLAGSLPEKHLVWRIVQDHVNKDLLFLGTEFGVFFTVDGGKKWVELNGGIPTISTRDVKIHRGENDLVAGTFGRGIYILDDYTPLRSMSNDALKQDALLFAPGRPVKWYRQDGQHTDTDGDDAYTAKNPAHGATFTYYLKDSLKTLKAKRKMAEKAMIKDGKFPKYPSWEAVEKEIEEAKPSVYLEITDADGNFVNRVAAKAKKGLHRMTWNMTYASSNAVTRSSGGGWNFGPSGVPAKPGMYSATLFKREGSDISRLTDAVSFELKPIYEASIKGSSYEETLQYHKDVNAAKRRSTAAAAILRSMESNLKLIRTALDRTPGDISSLEKSYAMIRSELQAIDNDINGLDSRFRKGAAPTTTATRIQRANWISNYGPSKQNREQFAYGLEGLNSAIERINSLKEVKLPALQQAMIEAGAPWTPGAKIPAAQ
ncbi:glycosyl hydrolase [Temperatibacter marinus]|uniref:Glycosyl hydrolase n=1 Tax=Temperatibacter marinus TaxID=1456591 RepID=A0AA52EAN7_9PROT|nr:glycosyl hydrolase [Temperatibacter marinus]WND01817.1 glycosyl hydrolase [Temperatibacter marinus]